MGNRFATQGKTRGPVAASLRESPTPSTSPNERGVASRFQCPRCGGEKSWLLRDGRRRCARCRFDWKPGRLPLRLTAENWRELLKWFVRGAPSAQIAHETRLERKRVLRALTAVRRAILRSPNNGRRGRARGSDANGRHVGPRESAKYPRPRSATIGLYVVNGRVGAAVIPEGEAEQLGTILRERKSLHSHVSPSLQRYAAVVYRGRFYRLARATAGHPAARFGRIEAFWAYLQRNLRGKGGIRRERLELYLSEYVWRYNHRHLSPAEQLRKLLELITAAR
jgi:transposase